MKYFIHILGLTVFLLTDMVYATCPPPDYTRGRIYSADLEIKYGTRAEETHKQFSKRFGDFPGMSSVKKHVMLYIFEPTKLNGLITSDFSFGKDFDDLVKKIERDTPLSMQEHKIDDETSGCAYYVKVDGTDILLLSFRAKVGEVDPMYKGKEIVWGSGI